MTTRERIALAWPPMLLRFALAVTFIWAGAGKVFNTVTITPAEAALLGLGQAATGVTPSAPATTPTTPPATPPTTPTKEETPTPGAPAAPLPAPDKPKSTTAKPAGKAPAKKDSKPVVTRTNTGLAINDPPAPAVEDPGAIKLPRDAPVAANPTKQTATPDTTAGSREERALYKLALMMKKAGNPGNDEQGKPKKALMPAFLSGGDWPVRLAWTVAVIELVGGMMVLVGMFTRIWSLGMAGVMAGAIWLVDIGPAMAAGTAVLGFLPNHPAFSVPDWQGPLWRLGLLCMSMALVFAGPGLAALDNVLFSSPASGGKEIKLKPPA